MDMYLFNRLSLNDKAKYSWQHGRFLGSVNEDKRRFNLYRSENFFISIEYSEDNFKIVGIEAFESSKTLDKFLHGIEDNTIAIIY